MVSTSKIIAALGFLAAVDIFEIQMELKDVVVFTTKDDIINQSVEIRECSSCDKFFNCDENNSTDRICILSKDRSRAPEL